MTSNHKRYVLPAEWHRQACVQLTWPHKDTDWSPYLEDITETKAIAHYEPLVIAAKYPEEVREMLSDNLNEEEMNRVSIYECDNNDTWARDHAFITLIPADDENPTTETSDAESTACRLLDFRFNGWLTRTISSTVRFTVRECSVANVPIMTTSSLKEDP